MKNKFYQYIEQLKSLSKEKKIQITVISSVAMIFLILSIFIIDLIIYKDSRIKNRLAQKFCDCTLKNSIQKGSFEEVEEGFQYASGLDDCYAVEFKKYNKGLTDLEKEAFIEDVQDRVFKKCPASVEKVFGITNNQ
jgi:hypothetical protein